MRKKTKVFRLILILWMMTLAGTQAWAQCGQCQFPVQLVTNGNFSSGNTGFSTSLNLGSGFFCPLCPEGTYAIGANAIFFHSDFLGTDHTNPPTGSFFIANGAGGLATSEVWCQTITVQPQTDYTFTFWGRDVTNNSNPHPLALLHASFNGEWIGDSLICSGGWQSHTVQWNSQSLTSVEICIVNTQSQGGGNDFGLDEFLRFCREIDAEPMFQLVAALSIADAAFIPRATKSAARNVPVRPMPAPQCVPTCRPAAV